MKIINTITLILVHLAFIPINAQVSSEVVPKSRFYVGELIENDERLIAHALEFDQHIYAAYYEDSLPYLIVVTRNPQRSGIGFQKKGIVYKIDKESGEVLFKRELNLNKTDYHFTKDKYIEFNEFSSSVYDLSNGKKLFSLPSDVPIVLQELDLAVGYKWTNNDYSSNTLEAYDLNTGETRWSTYVSHKFGWGPVKTIGDSLLLIIADGLYGINLKSGATWHLDEPTGYLNRSGPLDLSWTTYQRPLRQYARYGLRGHVSGGHSNVLLDSTSVFFASADFIHKLDLNGNIIWREKLPENFLGKSLLHNTDSNIYLFNYAHGVINQNQKTVGIPFFASFSKENGDCYFFNQLSDKVTNEVPQYAITSKAIYTLFEHQLSVFELIKGEQLSQKTIGYFEREATSLMRSHEFTVKDSELVDLNPGLDSLIGLRTIGNGIERIHQLHPITLEEINKYRVKKLWVQIQSFEGYKILATPSESKCLVIESETKHPYAILNVDGLRIFHEQNMALAYDQNVLFMIPLNLFIPSKTKKG